MTSDLLHQIISGMPVDFADAGDDYLTTRRQMAPLHGHPLAATTSTGAVDLGGVRGSRLVGAGADGERGTALFVHGGAFVSCDLAAYQFYAEYVSEWVGVPVVTVDYRLAPEHPYPAALDDCVTAYRGLLDQGQDPARLIWVGDSCGGGLVLAALLRIRDSGLPMPAGAVSLSGWVDLDTVGYAGARPPVRDPFITEGFLRARARDYVAGRVPLDHPDVSPARGELGGLPPLLLQVGETDLCRRDAERMAARARQAGVDARVDVVAGGVHGVQGLVNLGVPEAISAWRSVRRFADELLWG